LAQALQILIQQAADVPKRDRKALMVGQRESRGSRPCEVAAGCSVAQPSAAALSNGTGALVPLHAVGSRRQALTHARRPAAAFLAQLIAIAQGEAQTCARRRAEPRQAAQAYRAAAMGWNTPRPM
jgi:hypothetical protein